MNIKTRFTEWLYKLCKWYVRKHEVTFDIDSFLDEAMKVFPDDSVMVKAGKWYPASAGSVEKTAYSIYSAKHKTHFSANSPSGALLKASQFVERLSNEDTPPSSVVFDI